MTSGKALFKYRLSLIPTLILVPLLIAITIAWPRSYWASTNIYAVRVVGSRPHGLGTYYAHGIGLQLGQGGVGIKWSWTNSQNTTTSPTGGAFSFWLRDWETKSPSQYPGSMSFKHWRGLLGIGYAIEPNNHTSPIRITTGQATQIWMPIWPLALLIGFAAYRSVRKSIKRHYEYESLHQSLCPACGYPHQNSPSPTCPECGETRPQSHQQPTQS